MHKPHAFQKGFACQQTDTFDQMNDQSLRQFLFSRTHAAPPSITFSQSERLKSTIGVGTDILKHIIGPSIFVSAGGAISFSAVKSVLSDAQQFYWMNNLCSQSEHLCWRWRESGHGLSGCGVVFLRLEEKLRTEKLTPPVWPAEFICSFLWCRFCKITLLLSQFTYKSVS